MKSWINIRRESKVNLDIYITIAGKVHIILPETNLVFFEVLKQHADSELINTWPQTWFVVPKRICDVQIAT